MNPRATLLTDPSTNKTTLQVCKLNMGDHLLGGQEHQGKAYLSQVIWLFGMWRGEREVEDASPPRSPHHMPKSRVTRLDIHSGKYHKVVAPKTLWHIHNDGPTK